MKTKTLFSPNLTLEEAKELIKNGADVNEQGPESRSTPIFYVDNIEVAKLLIKHGADAIYQNIYKATPLFNFRSLEMALLLLNNGANINAAIPTYGNLIMLRFVESNGQINFDELKILIAHGAIFDTKK
jgi:ankyrin repeat protein